MNFNILTWKGTFWALLVPLAAIVLAACATTEGNDQEFVEGIRAEAAAAEASGDYRSAALQYRKLSSLRPNDDIAILSLSRNLRRVNAPEEAISVLSPSKGIKEDDPAFVIELSKAEISAGKSPSALARLSVLNIEHANNWDIHATMGIAYDMLGSYGQAWQAYTKAMQISPNNPTVINNMALSAASSGRLDEAISILENAPMRVRNKPQIRQNMALLYGVRGDFGKAEALSRMDLEEKAVRNNMEIYSGLRGDLPNDIRK